MGSLAVGAARRCTSSPPRAPPVQFCVGSVDVAWACVGRAGRRTESKSSAASRSAGQLQRTHAVSSTGCNTPAPSTPRTPTHLPTYPPTHLPTYPPTHLPTYPPTPEHRKAGVCAVDGSIRVPRAAPCERSPAPIDDPDPDRTLCFCIARSRDHVPAPQPRILCVRARWSAPMEPAACFIRPPSPPSPSPRLPLPLHLLHHKHTSSSSSPPTANPRNRRPRRPPWRPCLCRPARVTS